MVPVWRLCPVIVRHHVIDFDLVLFHQVCRQRGCAFDGLFEVSVLIDANLYSDADMVAPSGEICMIALLVRREVLNDLSVVHREMPRAESGATEFATARKAIR